MITLKASEIQAYLASKSNGFIVRIEEDIEFIEDVVISRKSEPISFRGEVISKHQVTIGFGSNVSFYNASISSLIYPLHGQTSLFDCKFGAIKYDSQNINNSNKATIKIERCNIDLLELYSDWTKIIINESTINNFSLFGRQSIDLGITGKTENTKIGRLEIRNLREQTNNFPNNLEIFNCIIGSNADPTVSKIEGRFLDVNLTAVSFINTLNLIGKENKITMDQTEFDNLIIEGFDKFLDLINFKAKKLSINNSEYNSIFISKADLGILNLENLYSENKENKPTLILEGIKLDQFILSQDNLKKLEINGSDKETKINSLKVEQFIEIFCDAKDKKIEITNLEFTNCTIPKDNALKFFNTEIQNLSFIRCLNYGNVIFTDITSKKEGLLKIMNSDLGKMIFMKCDFSKYKLLFHSSKITEIFLAGTSMPSSPNINIPIEQVTESKEPDFENKRLALTQLKKVFDNRGDSINSTLYHNAELEVWEIEPFRQEYEEKKSVNNNLLKGIKLKIFNWISLKLFPEYWNLSIENLDHKKLIFSQYKKMYEGRGDTVKAIEYQGKELDVHRTILCKEGGRYLERLQLSLNKYSNNFGQSWHWAVCWIIGLGIFIYFFYCHSLGFTIGSGNPNEIETFNKLFSYFFEFLNPIRKGEFIQIPMFIEGKIKSEYVTITGWARFIDFIWRIIITYLGYQLIQAFRKYSKKTS